MTKKIVIFILILSFGILYGFITKSSNDEILGYLDLNKSELIGKLGNNYKIIPAGPEGAYEGYYYPKIGITIDFDDTDKVADIYCDKIVTIKGVKAGLNFEQIQKVLGKTKIHEIFDEESNFTVYQIWYFVSDNCKFIFMSDKSDGSDSSFTICRIGAAYNAPTE